MNSLHILYTANLRGNIELLPRLQTFLRQLKSLPLDEGDDVMICAVQPVARQALLLDLGDSCSSEAWHCAATNGRSMLMGLDALGYQAAHVSAGVDAETRARMRNNLMEMALVDAENPYEGADMLITADTSLTSMSHALQIVLTPTARTHLHENVLFLASVQAEQVGAVHVGWLDNRPKIQAHTIFDLPPTIAPDPTIAGIVDFILSEARQYQRRNEKRE
jgi:hypothetical protein